MSWGDHWRDVLDDGTYALSRRVRQGRASYRSGRVSDVRITIGRVSARVQGSRATPFLVEVEIPVLPDADWDIVIDMLAARVRYSARLLAGHHPEGLLEEAAEAGVHMMPRRDEISVAAGHSGESPFPVGGAAVWEAVADRLDNGPFALMKLRGRGRERILRDIARRRRMGTDSGPAGVDVAEIDVVGWSSERAPLVAVSIPQVTTPHSNAPALHVLGDPEGWAGAVSAAELFGPMIAAASWHAKGLLEGPPDILEGPPDILADAADAADPTSQI